MPEDVLEHDDRVIDQHPGAERQSAQAHEVEADAKQVEQAKGQNHADRDGKRDSYRIACIVQEEKEDEEGEGGTKGERLHDIGDGVTDEPRLRIGDRQLDFRVFLAQLSQHLIDALGHLHRIGARLLI